MKSHIFENKGKISRNHCPKEKNLRSKKFKLSVIKYAQAHNKREVDTKFSID